MKIDYGFYSFSEYLRLIYSKVLTMIFYKPARLIRHPIRLRGCKRISFSKGFTCGYFCRIEAFTKNGDKTLFFGQNVNIGDFCHITSVEKVVIGNNVLVGSSVFISDHDHGDTSYNNLLLSPAKRDISTAPVIIEDNVWIGEKAIILKGVTIGANSVIAASSVVTKNVAPFSVVAGVPAKVVKKYEFKD
ncbi:MAG: DapH/DapD/GlmU-related protein [Hydrogenovibrio sp.]